MRKELEDSKFCLKEMVKYVTVSYGCFKGKVYLLYFVLRETKV